MSEQRRTELRDALQVTRARIDAACLAASRRSDDVTLVVVTKTFPASDVRLLAGLGVHDVGENRDQEAAPKAQESADLELSWHFVGRLQSNKARSVASYATAVHSVDRAALARALGSAATRAQRTLDVLVQVSLDGDPARGGVPVGSPLDELLDQVAALDGLQLRGLMAVAPLGVDPAVAFGRLAEVAEQVRRHHPEATWLSAGMSGDLEPAIEAGATHLRVGSAILGSRPPLG